MPDRPDLRLPSRVQAAFAATLVDEWARCGVSDAVVAPGSRCTPLTLALADDIRVRLHVHLDERSAAFFALGLGLASGRPAVVVTTSGTAATELHPAVVEAHQARVPLIACTADRPPELHHVGAPQTIEQGGLFAGAVRWAFEPGVPDARAVGWWRSLAARAVLESTAGPAGPGPVHLNLAFREPLVAEPGDLPPGRPEGRPWHAAARPGRVWDPDPAVDASLSGRRGVMVAGAGSGSPTAVSELATRLGWPVLADPRSGCRGGPCAVAAFDGLLRHQPFADTHWPDVVIRLGQPPASKALTGWLGRVPATHVVVDPYGQWPDPDRTAGLVVAADPAAFCRAAGHGAAPAPEDWLGGWLQAEAAAQAAIDEVLARHPEPTEPGVARALTASLPGESILFVSSSMPVRDVEWYGHATSPHRVLANRGANGIDGIVSTALGVAAAEPARPVVAVLGDLAFVHDGGGLLWATRRGLRCTLVVVDNDGGGIFSFLPQAGVLARATFETLLGTPHGLDLGALAAVHGVTAETVGAAGEVVPLVLDAISAGGVRMVHVRTDRAANVVLHGEIHQAIAAAIAHFAPEGD